MEARRPDSIGKELERLMGEMVTIAPAPNFGHISLLLRIPDRRIGGTYKGAIT